MPDAWNCHGSTRHSVWGEGAGSYDGSNLETALTNNGWNVIKSVEQATQGQAVNLGTLKRRDVIFYFHRQQGNPNWIHMHTQVVISGTTTYGANNQQMPAPGAPANQSWKWFECAAGHWADNLDETQVPVRPILIRVYRK